MKISCKKTRKYITNFCEICDVRNLVAIIYVFFSAKSQSIQCNDESDKNVFSTLHLFNLYLSLITTYLNK